MGDGKLDENNELLWIEVDGLCFCIVEVVVVLLFFNIFVLVVVEIVIVLRIELRGFILEVDWMYFVDDLLVKFGRWFVVWMKIGFLL